MSHHDHVNRVWDMIENIEICMLATRDGDLIRSRPMRAHPSRDEHAVYLLTDAADHKDEEIEGFPNVCLAFADPQGEKYVSLTGRAQVSRDRAKIEALWDTPAKAWWDSPDDPNIRLLTVTPNDAQYWDGNGPMVSYVKMLAAAATGDRPDVGERKKVAM